jgi:hypothetical protein
MLYVSPRAVDLGLHILMLRYSEATEARGRTCAAQPIAMGKRQRSDLQHQNGAAAALGYEGWTPGVISREVPSARVEDLGAETMWRCAWSILLNAEAEAAPDLSGSSCSCGCFPFRCSPLAALRDYIAPRKPVRILGILQDPGWKASERWDDSYLSEHAGDAEVELEVRDGPGGSAQAIHHTSHSSLAMQPRV